MCFETNLELAMEHYKNSKKADQSICQRFHNGLEAIHIFLQILDPHSNFSPSIQTSHLANQVKYIRKL